MTRKHWRPSMKKFGRCASICICAVAWLSICNVESLVVVDTAGKVPLLRGSRAAPGASNGHLHRELSNSWRADAAIGRHTPQPLNVLRGGAGIAKKLGAKNLGLLMVLLSILYAPSAMSGCSARIFYVGRDPTPKIQRMGCTALFTLNNIVTLIGLTLVLANSRKFDRYGRSKFKMRLTGSLIIFMGMMLVIAHAETARINWYSRTNAYLGVMLEWWGFASLFYNFTPKFVAQVPREMAKLGRKLLEKAGLAAPAAPPSSAWASPTAQYEQQREIDRLNRWAQADAQTPHAPAP